MADRIVRDELLESSRWLGLRDNTARVCYITLILKADALGNLEAHTPRLVRLWRDYGVASAAAVEGTLEELATHDMIRLYEAPIDGVIHRYLHIPRSRQNLRFVKRIFPLSPWTTSLQIQRLKEKSPGESITITGCALGLHGRSDVDVDVEKKRKDVDVEVKTPSQVSTTAIYAGQLQPLLNKNPFKIESQEQVNHETEERNRRIAKLMTEGKTVEAKALSDKGKPKT